MLLHICSGSMEPAFYRGDLLFLTNHLEDPVQAGEILVFKVKGRDIPIVHRVIKLHEKYVCWLCFHLQQGEGGGGPLCSIFVVCSNPFPLLHWM